MRSARSCFNLLLTALLLALFPAFPAPSIQAADTPDTPQEPTNPGAAAEAEHGKDTKKKKRKPKPIKVLRVHVEARRDLPQRSLPAEVGRRNPLPYNIEKLPILSEQNIERVSVVDQPGGFQVRVKFDSTGTRLLESYTAAAAGRHLIVATEIDEETRWLAAPLVRQRIGDGVLAFSPDASREEMERMVRDIAANQRKEKRNRWLP